MPTLKWLAERVNAEWSGDPDVELTHACGLDSLVPGGIAYVVSPAGLASVPVAGLAKRGVPQLEDLDLSGRALVVPPQMKDASRNLILAEDPLATHVEVTLLLHPEPEAPAGVHPSAVLGNQVELGEGVSVGPHAVLHDGVRVGPRTVIHAGVVLMHQVEVGADCVLYPNAVVQHHCMLGNQVLVQSNAVIGADGHGYFQRDGVNRKIPQVGYVVLEDDVEIGAATTIDRARFTVTRIGAGCKIDNQVQIAHNVDLGPQALVSAQTAIGGSVKAGSHLILGGQTGVRDNVTIGHRVSVMARGVITSNTPDSSLVAGMPGRPAEEWRQTQSNLARLDELFQRVRALEDSERES